MPTVRTPLLHNRFRAAIISMTLPVGAAVVMVALALHTTEPALQRVDEAVLRFMVRIRVAPLTWLALALNVIGSTVVTAPVRGLVVLWLGIRRRWWALGYFVLANALAEVTSTLLKNAYDRVRPPGSLVTTSGASFPSGHAVATSVIAVSLVIVLFPPGPARRKWELWAIGFTLLMGVSRAYLAAHWLSDAVAGVLIGSAIAVGMAVAVETVHDAVVRRRDAGPPPPSAATEVGAAAGSP
jgi:membrane-associated phospholipid phosphatase